MLEARRELDSKEAQIKNGKEHMEQLYHQMCLEIGSAKHQRDWDLAKLNEIIDEQRRVTAEEKLRNQKTPLTSCLLYLDDWTDRPDCMKAGIITQLFCRNRHYGLSVWVHSQKCTSLSLTCRVNNRWMLIWRLRSQKEIDTVLEEMSALNPVGVLREMYETAVGDAPYSWWYCNMSASEKADMFWVRFEESLVLD